MGNVPVNPDGTPILVGATSVPTGASAYSLYDVPTDLSNYLDQTSGGKLFFDIGQHNVKVPAAGTNVPGVTQPGLIGGFPTPDHVTMKHKSEAYNIMQKPWQIMQQFQAMSYNDPARFAQLQEALGIGGVFGDVNVNGVFDAKTEKALGAAMLQYVKLSMGTEAVPVYEDPTTHKKSGGFVAYLLNSASTANALGAGQSAARQVQLTDPAQIRQAAMQAAQDALGQGLNESQLTKFVNQFQASQTAAQTTTGTSTSPDLGAQAMSFAQQANPTAYKQNQRESYLDQLVNLLGGSRPNQQPVASAGGGK